MHWTYTARGPDDHLEQGDFLVLTDGLRSVLDEVHPHFCGSKYIGFTVATQSCDLVRRRGNRPKAQYINIASVRSLKEVAPRLLSHFATAVAEGVFFQSGKQSAKDFLTRLFNQNEQSLGLFYFHPDADIGLGERSVAFLRVAIALRAEHYDVLLQARRGGLKPAFQAKFGWLVGNLYSRAATPDWSDQEEGDKQLESLVSDYLEEQLLGFGPIWIEDELVAAGRKADVSFHDRNPSDLKNELEQYRPEPPLTRLVTEVEKQAKNSLTIHEPEVTALKSLYADATQKIVSFLASSFPQERGARVPDQTQPEEFGQREIMDIMQQLEGESVEKFRELMDSGIVKLANRLRNNGRVKKLVR